MRLVRKLGALLVVMLVVLALGLAPAARAASAPLHVFPPQARPYGHTYSEWAARFWQWDLAIPKSENLQLDRTGAHCAVGQSGQVWYLTGNMGGTDTRTCTVPAGEALLLAPVTAECSTVEGNGNTYEALRSCAHGFGDEATAAGVTVDGILVPNPLARYRVTTSMFTFAYPKDFLFAKVPGPGTGRSVADGVFVMLAPLAAGQHAVELSGAFGPPLSMTGKVTYHLTIRR